MASVKEYRLSHAYCPSCDIYFTTRTTCPRCNAHSIVGPPPGSPPPQPARGGREKRAWISRDLRPESQRRW